MKKLIYNIGIDIGGSNIKAVLFDGKKIISDSSLTTPKDSLDHFLVILKALIEPLLAIASENRAQVEKIGVGVAGIVNQATREIIRCPNISILDGAMLGKLLADKFSLPIFIDNDTNCFTRAESQIGAAKKYQNIFGVIMGTGIGGAWFFRDDIYLGSRGSAGEIGWLVFGTENPIALEDAYHRLAQNNPEKLAAEAYLGDELAKKSYQEIGRIMGMAFANIINLLDPELIVIGGGLVKSDDLFLPEAEKMIRKFVINPRARNTKILIAKFGELSGAIGATLLEK